MAEFKNYEILNESFIAEIKSLVKDDFFKHYYLINVIEDVFDRHAQFDEAFIIKSSTESWIIGFSAFGNFLLYGNNWNDEQLDITVKKLGESNIENGFHLAGTFDLLQEIKPKTSFDTETFKERIFYSCKNLLSSNFEADIHIGYAEMKYHQKITEMVCEYFEYEYNGKNNKDFNQMLPQTFHQIVRGSLWQITNSEDIIGFCSIVETSVGISIIGSFFVSKNQRNSGYGTLLLEKVSLNLLKENDEVWLLSDKNDSSSNKIFVKLGYKPVYETGDYIVLK